MAKSISKFVCQQCGHEETKWFGKCPDCGTWNSAVETVSSGKSNPSSKNNRGNAGTVMHPVSLSSIKSEFTARTSTKISELDRVLGGGLVSGQVILIAGEPGIGKSTLLLQVADQVSTVTKESSVLYICGEESPNQIKIRANRLGITSKSIDLLETTDIDGVIETAEQMNRRTVEQNAPSQSNGSTINQFTGLSCIIVDSIQTMATSDLSGMAGSVGQVRECTFRLVRFAKENNIPIFIVGHVTKEGTVAGPSVLMHIVDTVLWFEGDKSQSFRFLRAVKNRFGATDEVGVFAMEDKGLVSLDNPEKLFLADAKSGLTGTVIGSVMQGSRPLLIEIQSLIVPTKLPIPRRVAQGIDPKRFELLLAVLTRRAGLPLYDNDCFVNIAGGISVKGDPSADLGVCLSVASSFLDKPLPNGTVAIGEVGLLGDIRPVVAQEKRIKEAKRLGYKNVITNKEGNYLRDAIRKYLR